MTRWWFDPFGLAGLLVAGLLYARGVARLWRAAGPGRGLPRWQVVSFAGGWIALVAALLSPIAALSELLFSVHMTQHEILMLVAAPLLVLGRPLIPFLWALPSSWRRRMRVSRGGGWIAAWNAVTGPLSVFVLQGAALWVWHLPVLYEAALGNPAIHAAQHLCFLGTSCLFWWALTHGRYGRMGYGVGVLYVFLTAVHTGALGALLTFSPRVLYPWYVSPARHLHVNPLEDQQLGGLLMWVPCGVVLSCGGLAMFAAWLGESERRTRAVERPGSSRAEGRIGTAGVLLALLAGTSFVGCGGDRREAERLTGGNVERAPRLIGRYGCGTCHSIPGIAGASGTVGPPMDHIASRMYIAGRLRNDPAAMIQWLRNPQHFQPGSAMPEMGVSESDARDIAAYLYTLR